MRSDCLAQARSPSELPAYEAQRVKPSIIALVVTPVYQLRADSRDVDFIAGLQTKLAQALDDSFDGIHLTYFRINLGRQHLAAL